MYTCQFCKKRFALSEEAQCGETKCTCPYCGSKDVRKNSIISLLRGILSSGGG
jgi:DNA-directed RNA polymerase subunit RPC12/RpoP